ncbi:unnamed protein product [Brassica oleracea]|uniref:(rape) hypothetical protein n=1 Tax=Brassica napus TaxID=3708 RepID=A0A816MPP6_BRANA|nr:unnamed protein product [Brassica napus]
MSSTLRVRFCRNLQSLMMFDPFVRRRFCRNLSSSSTNGRRLSVAYHIIPQCLSFTDLCLLQPLSRLLALLPGNSIVVTNNSGAPLIASVFFTTAALTNGFCFVTMGYAQLVIRRTMNVVNLDPAAEIFNYHVAMKSDWNSSIRKCQHSPWSWCCVKIARLNLFHTSTTVDLW